MAAGKGEEPSRRRRLAAGGTVCRFECMDGFRLIGSRGRACLPIGVWSGVMPLCKGECTIRQLSPPPHVVCYCGRTNPFATQ